MVFKQIDLNHVDKTLRENRDELRRIDGLVSMEQQGYAAAPIFAAASGLDHEELLMLLVRCGSGDQTDEEVQRSIGLIRWLIDNR